MHVHVPTYTGIFTMAFGQIDIVCSLFPRRMKRLYNQTWSVLLDFILPVESTLIKFSCQNKGRTFTKYLARQVSTNNFAQLTTVPEEIQKSGQLSLSISSS